MADELSSDTHRVACPACGRNAGEPVLTLPPIPVHVGLLWQSPEAARDCAKGDFELALCSHCGYAWNTAFRADLLHYEDDYDNALHFSPKFVSWERELAGELIERHAIRSRRIAEIGCGDGRFLAMLCAEGDNKGVGFEPGHNDDRTSELVAAANVEIRREFADSRSLRGTAVDFVVARHVLEHLDRPAVLIEAIQGGMAPGGGVYVEVPNFAWALERGAFEDLMFEHCGYYTTETLAHLFRRHNFVDVVSTSTFDGLFAAVEAHVGNDAGPDARIDQSVIADLRRQVDGLSARIDRVDEALRQRADDGQVVVAWGGGARAVGLLNLVRSADAVDRVVDVNPRKQGTYVTGTGHPIVAPDDLVRARPDAVLVVNPVYYDEIAGMLSDLDVDAELFTI